MLKIGNYSLRLTKALFSIYLFYVVIISDKWLYIPMLNSILFYGTVFCACLEYRQHIHCAIGMHGLFMWGLLFLVLNLLFSYLTAVNFGQSSSVLSRFFQYLMMMLVCILIGVKDGNLRYFCGLLFSLAITMTMLIYIQPVTYFASSDYTTYLTITEMTSPHVVGIYILFGIWAMLYELPKYKPGFMVMMSVMTIMIIMTGAIFLTNSRKSLVGVAVLILFSIKPLLLLLKQSVPPKKRVFAALWFAVVIIVVIMWLPSTKLLRENNMIVRLGAGVNEESNSVRIDAMSDAFSVFLMNPIFGVGMDNYRYYSPLGIYSHNTYSELLSCCGLIGSFPFVCFVGNMIRVLLSKRFKRLLSASKEESYHRWMLLALVVFLLYMGMMQIMFYERTLMLALSIVATYVIVMTHSARISQMRRITGRTAMSGKIETR